MIFQHPGDGFVSSPSEPELPTSSQTGPSSFFIAIISDVRSAFVSIVFGMAFSAVISLLALAAWICFGGDYPAIDSTWQEVVMESTNELKLGDRILAPSQSDPRDMNLISKESDYMRLELDTTSRRIPPRSNKTRKGEVYSGKHYAIIRKFELDKTGSGAICLTFYDLDDRFLEKIWFEQM